MLLKNLNEGVYDKWTFKAVFLAGTPGSGKSFLRKKLFHSFKANDPDRIRNKLNKKKGIPLDSEKQSEEQKEYNKEISPTINKKTKNHLTISSDRRLPIAIDRTGSNVDSTNREKKKLEKKGYETKMIYVKVGLETAQKRNKKRGRVVSPEFIEKADKKIKENISGFKALFGDDFHVIDNSKPIEENQPEYDAMWNKIAVWMDKPVTNSIATAWRKEELRKKDRRVSGNIERIKGEIKGTLRR